MVTDEEYRVERARIAGMIAGAIMLGPEKMGPVAVAIESLTAAEAILEQNEWRPPLLWALRPKERP